LEKERKGRGSLVIEIVSKKARGLLEMGQADRRMLKKKTSKGKKGVWKLNATLPGKTHRDGGALNGTARGGKYIESELAKGADERNLLLGCGGRTNLEGRPGRKRQGKYNPSKAEKILTGRTIVPRDGETGGGNVEKGMQQGNKRNERLYS